MPSIDVIVDKYVDRDQLIDVYVVVDGATQGGEVTIRLEQVGSGEKQPASPSPPIADSDGRAIARFPMKFPADGDITLTASAHEAGPVVFPPKSRTIKVRK